MSKRGMTIIELMVAMSLFVIVMTLAIGGFVSISRSRILVGNMKDSQQKLRVANEMIVRYAKQAEYVNLTKPDGTNDGSLLEMYFDMEDSVNHSAKKFSVTPVVSSSKYNLGYSECEIFTADNVCGTWSADTNILGSQNSSIFLTDMKVFWIDGVMPAILDVRLAIRNEVPGYQTLSDEMIIENAIILGSLK